MLARFWRFMFHTQHTLLCDVCGYPYHHLNCLHATVQGVQITICMYCLRQQQAETEAQESSSDGEAETDTDVFFFDIIDGEATDVE
jgi:hypothetical protein